MPVVSDYLYAKASKNRIPLHGTFELTPVCNFACKMCYVRKTPEQVRAEGKCIRSWQDWLKLGELCRDAGMLYLLLTGGEPFIYPGFRQLYEGLQKLGLVISINSNGTMIDAETVEWLKANAPSRVNITLYGAGPETYERLCGRADGFEKAKNAIIMLKEAGIPVVINVSMIPENEADLEDIIEFGKSLGLNTRIATYMFPPARREREESDSRFTPEDSAKIYVRKLRCQLDQEYYAEHLKEHLKKLKPTLNEDGEETWGSDLEYMRCRAGRSTFWVSWEGKMTACGMVPFPLEVYPFEDSFEECWNSLTDAVRNTKVMRACNSCTKKEICQPCVAMLHSETGGVEDKAPYLCERTDYIIQLIEEEISGEENNEQEY